MSFTVSGAVLFAVLTIVAVRYAGLRTGFAVIAALAGWFLATSPVAPAVNHWLAALAGYLSGHRK